MKADGHSQQGWTDTEQEAHLHAAPTRTGSPGVERRAARRIPSMAAVVTLPRHAHCVKVLGEAAMRVEEVSQSRHGVFQGQDHGRRRHSSTSRHGRLGGRDTLLLPGTRARVMGMAASVSRMLLRRLDAVERSLHGASQPLSDRWRAHGARMLGDQAAQAASGLRDRHRALKAPLQAASIKEEKAGQRQTRRRRRAPRQTLFAGRAAVVAARGRWVWSGRRVGDATVDGLLLPVFPHSFLPGALASQQRSRARPWQPPAACSQVPTTTSS